MGYSSEADGAQPSLQQTPEAKLDNVYHIFSTSKMQKSLPAVAREVFLIDRAGRIERLFMEMVFALLYGLGLRVGEVARLKLGDVDYGNDILFIRETKFSKKPPRPAWSGSWQNASDATSKCAMASHVNQNQPLFSFTNRGCISAGTISQTFHSLLPRLALPVRPGMSSPRVHDLRHSFAVATLLRIWLECQGVDPNCRLMHSSPLFLVMSIQLRQPCDLTITEDLANMQPLNAPRSWLRKEECNEQCWSDHLRVFRGFLPQDPKGAQAWFYSEAIGTHLSSLLLHARVRLRADDRDYYTVLILEDLSPERVLDFLRMIRDQT